VPLIGPVPHPLLNPMCVASITSAQTNAHTDRAPGRSATSSVDSVTTRTQEAAAGRQRHSPKRVRLLKAYRRNRRFGIKCLAARFSQRGGRPRPLRRRPSRSPRTSWQPSVAPALGELDRFSGLPLGQQRPHRLQLPVRQLARARQALRVVAACVPSRPAHPLRVGGLTRHVFNYRTSVRRARSARASKIAPRIAKICPNGQDPLQRVPLVPPAGRDGRQDCCHRYQGQEMSGQRGPLGPPPADTERGGHRQAAPGVQTSLEADLLRIRGRAMVGTAPPQPETHRRLAFGRPRTASGARVVNLDSGLLGTVVAHRLSQDVERGAPRPRAGARPRRRHPDMPFYLLEGATTSCASGEGQSPYRGIRSRSGCASP
jgi:hypothetical protein